MLSRNWMRSGWATFALLTATAASGFLITARAAEQRGVAEESGHNLTARWEAPAREHRMLPKTKVHGTLTVDASGVTFRSDNGREQKWPLTDIRTAFLAPHRMVIETYENRSLHRPGERRYEFDLAQAMPASVAAGLAAGLARPLQNSVPDSEAPAIAAIPAHHRALAGGTNGVLRFREGGIDYVTSAKDDSRSWRWSDLETLSGPDPYHLFVFGYRDTYTFDLKAPLPRALFDRATDAIYAHNASIPVDAPRTATELAPHGAEMREKR